MRGPAGLTASFYTAREGIDTLLMESASFGGQIAATERLDNFPGFPEGITGLDFAGRLRLQALRFGVEMLEAQKAVALQSRDPYVTIRTEEGTTYSAEAVLLAMGGKYKRLDIPGEDEYMGAGVHFCSTCDGPFYKGKTVAVIGGGNSAAQESLFLTQFADSSINLELGFWIDDPEKGKGNIVSDVNFAIWRAFKENGVAIPFPQREVRILSGAVEGEKR